MSLSPLNRSTKPLPVPEPMICSVARALSTAALAGATTTLGTVDAPVIFSQHHLCAPGSHGQERPQAMETFIWDYLQQRFRNPKGRKPATSAEGGGVRWRAAGHGFGAECPFPIAGVTQAT